MAVDLIWLGLALLLAPVFGEYGKVKAKGSKGFLWLAVGGAMYLLAAAFSYEFWSGIGSTLMYGTALFSVIGLIATLIGALLVLSDLFK